MVQRALPTRPSSREQGAQAEPGRFRHYPRQPVRLRATLAHPALGWQREIDVIDLGIAGAGVDGTGEFEVAQGERLTIAFHAATLWDPLTLTARIAWVRPELGRGRAGIAFEHKSPQSAYALFELLASLTVE